MTRRLALALALLLVAAGCAGDDGGEAAGPTDLGDVELVAALTPFDSCDALLAHLREEALERVGPYGLEGQPVMAFAEGDVLAAGDGGRATAETAPGGTVPTTTVPTSSTNTQEAFVDEPDVVKVDAERLLVVDDSTADGSSRLVVVDLTGAEPVVRGRVTLPGYGHQLLVVGDRVLALAGTSGGPIPIDDVARSTFAPYGPTQATLTEIDVSDPDDPTVAHTLALDGAYLSARLVGDTARVVVSATNPAFPFVYPSTDAPEALAIAEEANRRLIEGSTIEDWLPTATLDGEPTEVIDCGAVEQPAEFSGFGFLTVLTVDLTEALDTPPATSVLADGQTVYASAEHLYVATSRPPEPTEDGGTGDPDLVPPVEDYETALHQFAITGDGAATYVASGVVPGHLLNQFSMSEHEGRLRVATTEGAPWSATETSASRVTVLEPQGDALVEVGTVEDLGVTEQIYAVRFVGDTGYVVTFRQTDPLFVLDLADPTAPTLAGELEIPGYSSYLHPLDEGHLLGIGQDADAQGTTRGLQVSVFDVTDPAAPTRVDQVVLPSSSSAAEYDHHAFLYWAPTGQAVVPVDYSAALVLSVGPDHVDEAGRITTPDGQEARRNVVVGDHLLTVTPDHLLTTDLATLTPRARISL